MGTHRLKLVTRPLRHEAKPLIEYPIPSFGKASILTKQDKKISNELLLFRKVQQKSYCEYGDFRHCETNTF